MASQRLSEFALHARAILGLPITPEHVSLTIPAGSVAASHAIVVAGDGEVEFTDVAAALAEPGTDLRIFAKPEVHGHRRMAVALAVGESEADARAKAGLVASILLPSGSWMNDHDEPPCTISSLPLSCAYGRRVMFRLLTNI